MFGSCFRMLAVILVSDFSIQLHLCSWSGKCLTIFLFYFFVTQLSVFLVFSKITRSVQLLSVCSVVSGKQSFWEFERTDICANAVRMNSPRDAKVSRPMMVFLKVGKKQLFFKVASACIFWFSSPTRSFEVFVFQVDLFLWYECDSKIQFLFCLWKPWQDYRHWWIVFAVRITDIGELFLQWIICCFSCVFFSH